MIRYCENCWENFDNEGERSNEFFCPKCMGNIPEVENW